MNTTNKDTLLELTIECAAVGCVDSDGSTGNDRALLEEAVHLFLLQNDKLSEGKRLIPDSIEKAEKANTNSIKRNNWAWIGNCIGVLCGLVFIFAFVSSRSPIFVFFFLLAASLVGSCNKVIGLEKRRQEAIQIWRVALQTDKSGEGLSRALNSMFEVLQRRR